MATIQPHAAGSVASPVSLSSTGQDVDRGKQPAVSQVEGMVFTVLSLYPKTTTSFFWSESVGFGESNMPEMNIDQSQRDDVNNSNSDTPAQVGEGQIHAEAQICMYNTTAVLFI